MRLSTSLKSYICIQTALLCSGFTIPSSKSTTAFSSCSSKLYSTTAADETAKIIITGNNIEVTPALSDYVETKLEKTLEKFKSDNIKEVDVHMVVNKNPKVKNGHMCEVVTLLKGTTMHIAEETSDMYASIDLVSDRLARQLSRFKERKVKRHHSKLSIGENMANAIEAADEQEIEEDVDTDEYDDYPAPGAKPEITKVKSFDLIKPISLEEAIFALDYVDHDFYVYRDQDTNEVSVVYKRNAGGLGLIQPSQ